MNKNDLQKLGLTKEALEAGGLTEDVVEKIIILHGKDIEGHKATIETLTADKAGLEGQLAEANGTIEGFKSLKPEELQKSVDDWKAKAAQFEQDAKTAREEAEARVQELSFTHDLTEALRSEYHAKDPVDIINLLDRAKITRGDDGKLIGLKEQIEPMVEAKNYLFNIEDPGNSKTPRIVGTSGGSSLKVGDNMVHAARVAAGLDAGE